MRSALLALVVLAFVAPASRAAESIGPYAVERDADAVTVRAGEGDDAALALVAGGLVLAAFGVLRLRRARRRGRPWIALGASVALIGATARLAGGAEWTVTPDGVTERRRFRVEQRLERAAIESIEVTRARPTGPDVKPAARPRLFELRIRAGGDEPRTVRFAFEREADARALGEALAQVLGAPLR